MPPITLSAPAKARMRETREWLTQQSVEHLAVWGIGTRGEITFEHTYTDGLHAQVSSNQDDIVLRGKVTESVGVICTHNHPHGTDPNVTEDDSRSTSELARRLQPLGIVLLASSVVSPPAQPPIQENRGRGYIPEIDAYQVRCQEYDRLWVLYGGKRPAWAGDDSMLESLKSLVLKPPAPAKTDNEALSAPAGGHSRPRRSPRPPAGAPRSQAEHAAARLWLLLDRRRRMG